MRTVPALLIALGLLQVGAYSCAPRAPAGSADAASQEPRDQGPKSPADIAEAALPSVVAIVTEEGLGSGFVVSADGLIATNLHVVAGQVEVMAVLHDRREFPVTAVYNADPKRDLAILKIDAVMLTPLVLGDSDKVRPGEAVVAIGHPLGLTDTVSSGLVGAVREVERNFNVLQVSAPIAPGSSGGPLIDAHGRAIGVATAILVGGQNLNLGVPINAVKDLIGTEASVSMDVFAKLTAGPEMPEVERQVPRHKVAILRGCGADEIELIVRSLEAAVQVGAPLYNQGDFASCYHVYEGAALDLERKLGRSCQQARRALAVGRQRAAGLGEPHAQAWAMRDAFDGLIDVIARWAVGKQAVERAAKPKGSKKSKK